MIIGAGLSGLIAAHAFTDQHVIEAAPGPRENHKALLRFRSDAVARLTQIEFKAVEVRKGIWFNKKGGWVAPSIEIANLYSTKVLGQLLSRSIWDVAPVVRYIAPDDFYERLIDNAFGRIKWKSSAEFDRAGDADEPWISTAPLPSVIKALKIEDELDFQRSPITVQRFRIPDCDVYQTVYFPSPHHSLYRASITGDTLILEFVGRPYGTYMLDVTEAFALKGGQPLLEMGSVKQEYGKIAPVDDNKRKALLGFLSSHHNIYSLGRFATWRNILLDDVVKDISVIKRLANMDRYEQRLATQRG